MSKAPCCLHCTAARLWFAGVVIFSPAVALAASPVAVHYVGRLGFRDSRHTRSDGYQNSVVLAINPAGSTAGESERFFGTPDPNFGALEDRSAWIGSPFGGSKAVGLYDADHTSATGYHTTHVLQMTASGKIIGHSTRYEGQPISRGQSAWIADWNGGTRRIGLFYDDEDPPLPDGSLFNTVIDVNESGQTIGFAPTYRGQSAWLAENNGATRLIGFYDSAHTTPGADPNNTPVALNESGTAIGHCEFNTDTQVVWLQPKNGGPPIQIGLYDAAHTLPSGRQHNLALGLNEHGYVIGAALDGNSPYDFYTGWLRRPNGSMVVFGTDPNFETKPVVLTDSNLVGGATFSYGGSTAWVYDSAAGTYHTVGLFYEGEGQPFNRVVDLTESGVAIGNTSVTGVAGYRIWVAPKNGPTYAVGYDIDLGGGGNSHNTLNGVADDGVVIGTSERNIASGGGALAWIASPVTGGTYQLGFQDATHKAANGAQSSAPTQVTNSHFVAGFSQRYTAAGTDAGQTAWVYNSPAHAYARFDISVRASDNFSFSVVHHVTENGIAFGTYTRFAADGTNLGDRAFVWITHRGTFDMGEALDVDPATVDWERLADAVVGNSAGFIAGHGVPAGSGDSRGVYLVKVSNADVP